MSRRDTARDTTVAQGAEVPDFCPRCGSATREITATDGYTVTLLVECVKAAHTVAVRHEAIMVPERQITTRRVLRQQRVCRRCHQAPVRTPRAELCQACAAQWTNGKALGSDVHAVIAAGLKEGRSFRQIARTAGVALSTVQRARKRWQRTPARAAAIARASAGMERGISEAIAAREQRAARHSSFRRTPATEAHLEREKLRWSGVAAAQMRGERVPRVMTEVR